MAAGPDYPICTLGTVPRAPEAKGAPQKEEGQKNMGTSDSAEVLSSAYLVYVNQFYINIKV